MIDELDENSAAGPEGIPAKLLKRIKKGVKKPLSMILRKSIEEGKIPEVFKLAYVTRNQFICAVVGYNMNHLKAHQLMDTMENDPF